LVNNRGLGFFAGVAMYLNEWNTPKPSGIAHSIMTGANQASCFRLIFDLFTTGFLFDFGSCNPYQNDLYKVIGVSFLPPTHGKQGTDAIAQWHLL